MKRSGMWGFKGRYRQESSERTIQNQNTACIIRSFFQNLLVTAFLTPHSPTFRCASCGAEIFCPFGTTAQHLDIIKPIRITYLKELI
ncbi:hypothetical protein Barb4_00207 [Bacteroidales bacterium Barb4]|nr:hypothetical protein Barb4_00207 [Bacteroidales bacterium Barb4]